MSYAYMNRQGTVVYYIDGQKAFEKIGNRPWRNNNPGNLRYGHLAKVRDVGPSVLATRGADFREPSLSENDG